MPKRFNFNDYYVEILKNIDELEIKAEKITPEYFLKQYHVLKEKMEEYNYWIKNYELKLKTERVSERFKAYDILKKRFKSNKKMIKEELKAQGVKVKPGSKLSKLLRQDYLPCPPDREDVFDDVLPDFFGGEIDGKRF